MEKVDNPLPTVTVICTCFNHANYVQEALASVLSQSYLHIQLIVVDNASSDNSVKLIQQFLKPYPEVQFIRNTENIGICRAFNSASKLAMGKYLIDLSADDVLMPERVQLQVEAFERLTPDYGLLYSNVEEINEKGKHIRYAINKKTPPSGHVFAPLLQSYFIPAPSTIFRKDIFESLGGYNESLAFEDFDFWVRCAHRYKFHYLPIVSTRKRILRSSLSMQFYSTKSDKMLSSTLQTYLWAKDKLQNKNEEDVYQIGLAYFFRQAIFLGHFQLAEEYQSAFLANHKVSLPTKLASLLLKHKINLSSIYLFYKQVK